MSTTPSLSRLISVLSRFCFYLFLLVCCVGLDSYAMLFPCADMVLNAEKRRMLAEGASKRKTDVDPFAVDASAPLMVLLRPLLSKALPLWLLWVKGKNGQWRPLPLRTRTLVLALSSRGNELSVLRFQPTRPQMTAPPASERIPQALLLLVTLWCTRARGRMPLQMPLACLLQLIYPPSSNRPSYPSKTGGWWKVWAKTSCRGVQLKALGSSLSPPALPWPGCKSCRLRCKN